jgi:hypothetical protein
MSLIDLASLFKKQPNQNLYQENMLNSNQQKPSSISQRG